MDIGEIAQSIGWVAHGFEFVQSIFPAWRFQVADCVADGGLHGRLFVGPRRKLSDKERGTLAADLSALTIRLSRNGDAGRHRLRRQRAGRADPGAGASGRGARQGHAQPAAARRRDRHHGNADARVSGATGRDAGRPRSKVSTCPACRSRSADGPQQTQAAAKGFHRHRDLPIWTIPARSPGSAVRRVRARRGPRRRDGRDRRRIPGAARRSEDTDLALAAGDRLRRLSLRPAT